MKEFWTIATGNVGIFRKASRDAAKFIASLDGFMAVHPHWPDGTLWMFSSENAAKIARNACECKGIRCGRNICWGYFASDGVPVLYPAKTEEYVKIARDDLGEK